MCCAQLMSKEQVATVKARIEAEQRLVEANAKSTKQLRDRVAKLLTNAYECLDKVCCPLLPCPPVLSELRCSAWDTSAACLRMCI